MRRKSIPYSLLKPLVNWACRLFYRNLHVRDSNRVCQVDAPIIIISNHQNALLDPLLCCITSPKQLSFLTRADVFKNSFARKALLNLNMLPVYRPHDKVNIVKSNQPTFRESLSRLEKNQVMALFPEGTHQKDQNLKPFKKGASRLIGDLFDGGKADKVIIQPVGLHFTNIIHSGYPGFVQFGEQMIIESKDLDLSVPNRSRMVAELTKRLRECLLTCVVHIDDDQHYDKKLFVFRVLQWVDLFSKRKSSVYEFKNFEPQLSTHLEKLNDFSVGEIKDVVETSFDLPALVLASHDSLRKKFSQKLLALIPIYLIGFLCSILPYLLGKALSKKMVKDIHFTSTTKIVSGFLLIPLFWIAIFLILMSALHFVFALLISVVVVFCGAIFLKYHTSYRILTRANTIRNQSSFSSLVNAVKAIG